MTLNESRKIVASMMAAFPSYRAPDVELAAKVWETVTDGYSYGDVSTALNAYMRTNTSGFAPTPGQLIDLIHTITSQPELNENEAWALVSKAIRRSGYYYVEEFDRLPPTVQKAVGSPSQLRTWALDEEYNEGVVSSHFIRCYREEARRKREFEKMPQEVQALIQKTSERLEEKAESQKAIQESGRRNEPANGSVPENVIGRVEEIWERNERAV